MHYPITIEKVNGLYSVSFKDIPEAVTQGETEEEAKANAADALLTAMDFYFEDRRRVPLPTQGANDNSYVSLPLTLWCKVLLLNAIVEQNISLDEVCQISGLARN